MNNLNLPSVTIHFMFIFLYLAFFGLIFNFVIFYIIISYLWFYLFFLIIFLFCLGVLFSSVECLVYQLPSVLFNTDSIEDCMTFLLITSLSASQASLVAKMVKNLCAMQKTWVPFLGQGDPLEKGMATHSSILVWRIPWTEKPRGLQSTGSQRIRHDQATNTLAASHMF